MKSRKTIVIIIFIHWNKRSLAVKAGKSTVKKEINLYSRWSVGIIDSRRKRLLHCNCLFWRQLQAVDLLEYPFYLQMLYSYLGYRHISIRYIKGWRFVFLTCTNGHSHLKCSMSTLSFTYYDALKRRIYTTLTR